jgi:hypothetical protein
MEPPNSDRHPRGSKLPRDRHRARILVGLDPGQADDAGMALAHDALGDLVDRNPDVHLVVGVDLDRHILAEHPAPGAILYDGVDGSH